MAKQRDRDRRAALQAEVATAGPDPRQCPACGSVEFQSLFETTDRLYRTTAERFHIVECGKCRVMRLYPRPGSTAMGRYARPAAWPEHGDTFADVIESAYRRFILADVVKFVVRALERAGGAGPVFDVSPDAGAFRQALREHGAEVITGESASGSCAVVTMLHVLEHMQEPAAALEAARGLLRPGGRLIVQSPNAACWQFLLLGENWSGIDVPRHFIHFRGEDIDALLECCGFEVLRRKHFSLRNPAGLATSIAPGLDPAVRRARGLREGPRRKLLKHMLYFGLMALAVPFTVIEAACRAGSRITIEARRKD